MGEGRAQGRAAPSIRRLLFDDLDVAQVLDEVAGDDLHAKDTVRPPAVVYSA